MMTITAGKPLNSIVSLAYRAGIPLMFVGRHGVAKSEGMAAAAEILKIGFIARDLSLMEPVDLVGMPRIGKGTTQYAPPSFLPTKGKGLLLIEELNRAPRYMRAPCLELLTARRLNDYRLPSGWLPCACINEAEDEYDVDDLDPALLSRFMQVRIEPRVAEWLQWAETKGGVHEAIIRFVGACPDVFADSQSNPRAWTYASQVLKAWEQDGDDREALAVSLAGILDDKWASAFLATFARSDSPLDAIAIIESYASHRPIVTAWRDAKQLDLIRSSLTQLQRHLQRQATYDALTHNKTQLRNVKCFLSDLPADLKQVAREWLDDRGFDGVSVPNRRLGNASR